MNEDYLYKAALALKNAKSAVKQKKYDDAWRLFHEQKEFYRLHANKHNFSQINTNALDAEVHEQFANVLRLEGRHKQAFLDILYWVTAQSHRQKKAHGNKLQAYFNRCKFNKLTYKEVTEFLEIKHVNTDYFTVVTQFNEWLIKDG